MSTRHAAHIDSAGPVTRAQRRAVERAAEHVRPRKRSATPSPQILLGALLIVAAIAAFLVATAMGTSGSSQSRPAAARALADPAALDPASSVLKVGTTAPNFSLRDAVGVRYSLSAY
jgi:hypothetical protein